MIAIASDHGGYQLKEHLKAYLAAKGITCEDFGTDSADSCDYPVFGEAAARMALDEMRAEGRYSKVCLCYVEGDEPARLLYEKLGFRHTGAAEENEIVMELTL